MDVRKEAQLIIAGRLDHAAPSVEKVAISVAKFPFSVWRQFVGAARARNITVRAALIAAVGLWLKQEGAR